MKTNCKRGLTAESKTVWVTIRMPKQLVAEIDRFGVAVDPELTRSMILRKLLRAGLLALSEAK